MTDITLQANHRNHIVDIGKGIAIILMCIGHSYCPEYLGSFISLFHMAFFFMMSGYFFSLKKVQTPKNFFLKRITGLYIPFLKWGIIFVFLHNIFVNLSLLSDARLYSFKEMCWKAFTTIPRFIPTEEMMGPYWFLSSLFYVSIFSFAIFWITEKLKIKESIRFCLFALFYLIGFILLYKDGLIFGGIIRTFVVSVLFYLGFLWKKFQHRIRYTVIGGFISFIILCIATLCNQHISIPDLKFENPISFLIYSISGCYLLLYISNILNNNNYTQRIFSYIGEHTLTILLANILCRRILHVIRFLLYETDSPLSSPSTDSLWWILYTVFMVCAPLFVRYGYLKIKRQIKN